MDEVSGKRVTCFFISTINQFYSKVKLFLYDLFHRLKLGMFLSFDECIIVLGLKCCNQMGYFHQTTSGKQKNKR